MHENCQVSNLLFTVGVISSPLSKEMLKLCKCYFAHWFDASSKNRWDFSCGGILIDNLQGLSRERTFKLLWFFNRINFIFFTSRGNFEFFNTKQRTSDLQPQGEITVWKSKSTICLQSQSPLWIGVNHLVFFLGFALCPIIEVLR